MPIHPETGNTSATFHRENPFPLISDIKVDLCVHRGGDKCLLKGSFPSLLFLWRPKSVVKGEMSRAPRLEGRLRDRGGMEKMSNLLPLNLQRGIIRSDMIVHAQMYASCGRNSLYYSIWYLSFTYMFIPLLSNSWQMLRTFRFVIFLEMIIVLKRSFLFTHASRKHGN